MTKNARVAALNRQIDRLDSRLEGLYGFSHRYSWLRFLLAIAGLLAAGLGLAVIGWWMAAICLAIGGLAFALAVYAHRRVENAIERHKVWRQIKQAQCGTGRTCLGADPRHVPSPGAARPPL